MKEGNRVLNFARRHPHAFKPKACRTCGAEFKPTSANSRYCSPVCRLGKNTCIGCGAEFIPSRHSRGAYCQRECWYEHKRPTGSTYTDDGGYVWEKVPKGTPGSGIYTDRKGNRRRWMLQHRYVMQQMLGRPLRQDEEVHHRNGRRDDNRPENLELWRMKSQPTGVRAVDYHCAGCRCHETGGRGWRRDKGACFVASRWVPDGASA